MVALHSECLLFKIPPEGTIPYPADSMIVELVGESILEPEIVREASASILYYFRTELGREEITVAEFASALEHVLHRLGYEVSTSTEEETPPFDPSLN